MLRRFRQKKPEAPSCPICRNLVVDEANIHISIAQLRAEASRVPSPCPCCTFLWQAISDITSDDTAHADIAFSHLVPNHDPRPTGPLLAFLAPNPHLGGPPIKGHHLQFYTLPGASPSPYPSIGSAPSIPPFALSPPSLALIRTWLTTCTTTHPQCRRTSSPTPLPTRLIDVRPSCPRLHLPTSASAGPYAALSHRWGGRAPVRTLTTNLAAHLIALPEPLPPTLADAVAVTRALGFPFLWIDALCILQDDEADWAREAARMGEVYSGALVTVSADAAGNCEAGFLGSDARMVAKEVGVGVSIGKGKGKGGEAVIYVRKRGELEGGLSFHGFPSSGTAGRGEKGDGGSKLSSRGWVFQERLLSPRIIYFSTFETAWECRALSGCECGAASTEEVLRPPSSVKGYLRAPLGPQARNSPMSALQTAEVETAWRHEVVEPYTKLGLTVVTDRLPALEGLARAMGNSRACESYLWGLWTGSLRMDLLWQAEGVGKKTEDLEFLAVDYAPTWSWASVTGPVAYSISEGEEVREEEVGVAEFDIDIGGSAEAVLKGRAWVVEMVLKWASRDVLVPLDADNSPPFESKQRFSDQRAVELGVIWDRRWRPAAGAKAVYTFLVVGRRSWEEGPFGLLLKAKDDKGGGRRFQRVGFVDGYRHGPSPQLPRRERVQWVVDDEDDLLTFVTGYRAASSAGPGQADLVAWRKWTERVMGLEKVRVEIA